MLSKMCRAVRTASAMIVNVGFFSGKRDEWTAIDDVEIVDVVRSAEGVQHRCLRIMSHPARTRLVARQTVHPAVTEEQLDSGVMVDGRQPRHHVGEERLVVVAERKADRRRRDAVADPFATGSTVTRLSRCAMTLPKPPICSIAGCSRFTVVLNAAPNPPTCVA